MRDFSRTTLKTLASRGINVIGTQAVPSFDGDQYFTGRAYRLDDNGYHKVRSHSEVMDMAK